jgi:uncharacterized protein (TIGR03000 family)
VAPPKTVVPAKKPEPGKKGGEILPPPTAPKKEVSLINIKLPPGARLLVDGQPAPPTGQEKDGVKTFRTPELMPGSVHSYTFVAIVTNETGRLMSWEKAVQFRAGESVTVDLSTTATGAGESSR